jgi:hypothetical protein
LQLILLRLLEILPGHLQEIPKISVFLSLLQLLLILIPGLAKGASFFPQHAGERLGERLQARS